MVYTAFSVVIVLLSGIKLAEDLLLFYRGESYCVLWLSRRCGLQSLLLYKLSFSKRYSYRLLWFERVADSIDGKRSFPHIDDHSPMVNALDDFPASDPIDGRADAGNVK